MIKEKWILCPVCGNKTRDKVREDTELKNFPLFCPKCKQETIINVEQMNIIVTMIPPMAKAAGVTEQLKATDQMRWCRKSKHLDFKLDEYG